MERAGRRAGRRVDHPRPWRSTPPASTTWRDRTRRRGAGWPRRWRRAPTAATTRRRRRSAPWSRSTAHPRPPAHRSQDGRARPARRPQDPRRPRSSWVRAGGTRRDRPGVTRPAGWSRPGGRRRSYDAEGSKRHGRRAGPRCRTSRVSTRRPPVSPAGAGPRGGVVVHIRRPGEGRDPRFGGPESWYKWIPAFAGMTFNVRGREAHAIARDKRSTRPRRNTCATNTPSSGSARPPTRAARA